MEGACSDFEPRSISTMKSAKRDVNLASKTEEIFFDNGDTLPACFNVDSRKIKEGKKLGEGLWTVYEAEWLGRKVAVKKFDAESTFSNVSLTSREVNRMLALKHPNVLKLLGFYLTKQKEQVLDCTMIMELMDFDLEKYLEDEALSNEQVVYITAEVARGMKHIHKSGCFHRDLKPKNILLKKSIVSGFHVDVKIADFGSSELMGVGNIDPKVGTLGYKAPEQFGSQRNLFLDKVDVFGFGALCFKILTGKEPYERHENVREAIEQIDRASISHRNLPEDVVEMIWKCLDVNAKLRPNFEKISFILDGALSAIREKMPRPLPLSTRAPLDSKDSMSKGIQGHDHLESILQSMGLSKKHAIHFIPFEELFVVSKIGHGAVSIVEWKGIPYALKVFLDTTLEMVLAYEGNDYFQTFPKLSHKNIVTFMGYSITPNDEVSIVMELLEMNLFEALHIHKVRGSKGVLDIQKKWMIVREIANGMKYLHNQGVVHGDLKPSNVVVSGVNTHQMAIKLVDFANGFNVFTVVYAAPERLEKYFSESKEYVDEKKCDVYSFGLLCQEILGGVPLSRGTMPFRAFIEALSRGKRPTIPIGTSSEMVSLIKSCWSTNPQERPDFTEICKRLSGTRCYQSCQQQNNVEQVTQKCWFL